MGCSHASFAHRLTLTINVVRPTEEGGSGNFVFSADPVSDEEDTAEEHQAVAEGSGAGAAGSSSRAQDLTADAAEEEAEGEEGEGEEEPEDDYNAAWEVLDVARTIYAKMVEGQAEGSMREEKLNLAECYLALGDVSCETGEFDRPLSVQTCEPTC